MALEALGKGFSSRIERVFSTLSTEAESPAARARLAPLGQDSALVERLAAYLDAVVEWNSKTDLTAARSTDELVDLFLADAIVLAGHEEGGAWVDVGTGAGAPGLVVAMMRPDVRMTLVEPKDRRVAFLRSMIGKFSLTRVTVERGRSDRLPGAGWDIAVSRATLPPTEWLREGTRLSRTATWVLLAKDEPPSSVGTRIDADLRYQWPITGAARRAVRYVAAPALTP
jgi:16S rRNA (guanine527-N7)-methyltransferase